MKNSLETRLGIFVALIVIAAVLIIETVGGNDIFKRGYRVNALFNSVQELKVGDRVKVAGVEVGRVEQISLTDNKVKVTMKLHAAAAVKTDSTATVKFAGLMGQNFVSLDFGSPGSPRATDGTFLATAEQPDLNTIMQKLDNVATGVENLTKSFTGDKIENLIGPITDFLKQNTQPLTETISNINNITGQIKSGQGTVGHLIYSNELYAAAVATVTNIQDAAAQIKTTIADAQTILVDAKAGKGTLGKLMTDETLYTETTGAMTNLHQILLKINNGQGTVGKLVNDQDFYKNAKLSLQKIDKMSDELEDQGPLTVIGVVAGKLF